MTKMLMIVGRICYWAGWPVFKIILSKSKRSRGVVICKSRILVVKSWLGNGKWNLPGGGIKPGESAITAFIRELSEETGVVVNQSKVNKIGDFEYSNDRLTFRYSLFKIVVDKCQKIERQKNEIYQADWIDVRDLSTKNSNSDVCVALSQIDV